MYLIFNQIYDMTINDRRQHFVEKSNKIHNNKYEYNKVNYINTMTKVKITCPIHGDFEQIPNNHSRGQGCPKCKLNKLKRSNDSFIKESQKIHNNKYAYGKTKYNGSNNKIIITCPVHGDFEQTAYLHLSGSGCPKCIKNKKHTTKDFIQKSIKIHGNKYDYSLAKYEANNKKVKIICPIHGEFEQQPVLHYSGKGCKKCAIDNFKIKNFIDRAKKIHENKYDYSLVKYVNHKTKVKIICPIHGMFEQLPYVHLRGSRCTKCVIKEKTSSNEEFISKAKLVHNNFYDYNNINYSNANNKINITCPIHGEFKQIVFNHLKGHGCSKCTISISKGAEEINNFLNNLRIKTSENDRSIIKPLELDIYIGSKNLAIEFNGLYYHSFDHKESKEEKYRHLFKTNKCKENNISLLQIFENEWYEKQEIVKSIILSKLNVFDNIVYARNCIVKSISNKEFSNFCNLNHIQGNINTKIKLGLICNNNLVSVMGFNKHKNYEYECTRYCNKINTKIIGGASKLFKNFLKLYNPKSILSYSDKRYFDGSIYRTLGFNKEPDTKPNYFYIKGKKLYSRQKFQKHKLKNLLKNFNPNISESENMFANGYRRIWDCGHSKYVYFI